MDVSVALMQQCPKRPKLGQGENPQGKKQKGRTNGPPFP
jgi:hypothetical protein